MSLLDEKATIEIDGIQVKVSLRDVLENLPHETKVDLDQVFEHMPDDLIDEIFSALNVCQPE